MQLLFKAMPVRLFCIQTLVTFVLVVETAIHFGIMHTNPTRAMLTVPDLG